MQKFSSKEAILFGWEKMKSNFWFFSGITLILAVLTFASNKIDKYLNNNVSGEAMAVGLIIWIVMIVFEMGIIKITLKIHDGQKTDYEDLFNEYKKAFNYFLASLIYIIIIMIGIMLLIVPGIIWGIKFQFYGYLIVDENLGPIAALKKSGKITKGSKINLFVLAILLGLVTFIGVIALVVGLFAAIPVTIMAMAFVYRKLNSNEKQNNNNLNPSQAPEK